MRWPTGHNLKLTEARGFYSIIAVATAVGVTLDFTSVDPIKALVWAAVINGVVAVPIMTVMMRMAVRPEIMGTFVIRRRLRMLGWLATGLMGLAVAAMLVSFVA